MPELQLPDWEDTPHIPSREYEVRVGEMVLLVHVEHRIPYVRMNSDFITAEAYGKRHLKPSVREGFYRDVRYILRELAI